MNNLKECVFPFKSFLGGWYIPKKLCDDIISFYKQNKKLCHTGTISVNNTVNINKKESMDLTIDKRANVYPFDNYNKYLDMVIKNYEQKYTEVRNLDHFNILENYNIQYYKPNQGFKIWHCERMSDRNRVFVFMTYLNDVEDGGTEFKYQKIITKAKKGLTLMWPSEWTHTHKGQISKTNEKYIITGWLGFTPQK